MEYKPTLEELLTHVDVGTDWLRLGVLLELDMKDLTAIERERPTIDERVQCMYALWLKTNPNATRGQLIKGLGIIRANTLTEKYKKWILSTTARPTATSKHTNTRQPTPSISKQTAVQQTLDITHLQKVLNLLRDAYFNGDWEGLGLELGLYQHPTLSNIQHTYGRGSALRECLATWLQRADGVDKNGGANYVSLANAVERLGQKAAADHIRRECQIDIPPLEDTPAIEVGERTQWKPLPVQEESYISEEEEEEQSKKEEDGGEVRHRVHVDTSKQQEEQEEVPPQRIKKGSSCKWSYCVLGGGSVIVIIIIIGFLVGRVYGTTVTNENEDINNNNDNNDNNDDIITEDHQPADITLDITDLQEILEVLKEGLFPDNRWFDLGLNLNLTHNDLSVIEEDRSTAHRRLQEMLSIWLRRGKATWNKLAKALRNIEEYKATKIAKAKVRNDRNEL